ncbi:hypothetical protein LLH03_09455 [bacterium]|nr:hypothetical protein [bacterium]
MKRVLLVLTLALAVAVPSFAQYGFTAEHLSVVKVPDFGWGIYAKSAPVATGPSFMLWVFPGVDKVGSEANIRAGIVRDRLVLYADRFGMTGIGHLLLTPIPEDADYSIMVEALSDGALVRQELVTMDERISDAYGATNKQLGMFWFNRLCGLSLLAARPEANWKTWAPDNKTLSTNYALALMANWRNWKGSVAPITNLGK